MKQGKVQLEAGTPRPKISKVAENELSKTGILGSERNRLYSFCIILVIALSILTLKMVSMAERSASTHKVAWVKMYANGTWDVELHENMEPEQFLQQTVDSLLSSWVTRRFSERPETIRHDYGFASLFMSEKARGEFVDPKGFNAAAVAAGVRECKGCDYIDYEVGPIDHFDQDSTTFSGKVSHVYRSNIFVDKKIKSSTGALKKTDKRVVRVQWRLMTPEEVQNVSRKPGGIDWLRKNPIGLEIVDYEELNDPSDN